MIKEKSCKNCKKIYEEDKCPDCGSNDFVEGSKGKVRIFDPEKSEIAKNVGITKKGLYAIKVR